MSDFIVWENCLVRKSSIYKVDKTDKGILIHTSHHGSYECFTVEGDPEVLFGLIKETMTGTKENP